MEETSITGDSSYQRIPKWAKEVKSAYMWHERYSDTEAQALE